MSWALASVAAPANCTASLGSIQNFGGYLGGALAPMVTGFIVQATGSFVPALLVGAAMALAAALAYLLIIRTEPISLTDAVVQDYAFSAATAFSVGESKIIAFDKARAKKDVEDAKKADKKAKAK